MNLRLILITILLATSAVLFAQREQISGTVVNRTTGNAPIANARVQISNNVDQHVVTTDELGQFFVPNLYAGVWRIVISADDFGNYETPITLQPNAALNLGTIFMFPAIINMTIMETGVGTLETEGVDHTQSGPALLNSSQDVFTNIANFRFGEMRFRARGYDWNLNRVYLNGLLMNDINTGNSPFSLWGGLNDVMRNQEISRGMQPTNFAIGNVAGTTNVSTRASQIRQGFQINYASSGGTYAHRLGVAWANEIADNLFLAVMGSVRYTPEDYFLNWNMGTYAQGFSYFLGLEKKFRIGESLSFTLLGAPIMRGVSSAAVQEVYDILDNPYYNPNMGWQEGKIRNARVRNSHEPVMSLDYTNRINSRLRVQATANYRFGRNGYTALDWYDAPDPRPDYYRYLPSFFNNPIFPNYDPIKALNVLEGWLTDRNIRYINWEGLYNVNYLNQETIEDATVNGVQGQMYSGLRSKYAIENRRADQRDFNTGITLNTILTDAWKVNGGLTYRWNRTHYFKEMYDLLGGQFWVDVDQFAERAELEDDGYTIGDQIQNDMNNPNRIVKKSDTYGYNYFAFTQRGSAWGVASVNVGSVGIHFGGDIGFTSFYREGLFRKGLFPDNSYGKSEVHSFLTYALQTGMNYQITGNHVVSANVNFVQQAPVFQDAFISPRTRNSTVNNLVPEKIFAADLSYSLRMSNMRFRIGGFYTEIQDRSRVMTFYDDLNRTFSNFAMSEIGQRHVGVEFGADVYVWNGFSIKSAIAYGDYIYNTNPLLTQTEDNSDKLIFEDERVYWKGFYVSGTPQLAMNFGIEYRAPRNWFGGIDLNYYDYSYIDMAPNRRMDVANFGRNTIEERAEMLRQEKFEPGFVLNANIGQWRTINRKYSLGVMLSINNILNNQNLKSGGFEQARLLREGTVSAPIKYHPFPSKYFYMTGTSYFLNVFFRF
ncbi:MAG: carboxypeptidase regulatory-like domain-containing protein [Bacteroidales bacterium]|nr:carboxypeptidase regulatory-like domain-containing protein [Bacteroidales bacterium]